MAESTTPADPTKARDWLYARGEKLIGPTPPPEPVIQRATPPAGFPPSIPLDTITFSDWSQYVNVQGVSVARVSSAADVAAVCNWAVTSGYKVRALVNLVLSKANPAPWLVFIEKHLERHFQSLGYVPERHDGRISLT